MKSKNCYLCGMDNYSIIFHGSDPEIELNVRHIAARKGAVNKEYSYTWVRCNICGLVYANPIPEEDVLKKLYMDSDQKDYDDEICNLVLTYGKYLFRYKDKIINKGYALDIGTGSGFFLKTLLDFGFKKVVGIEPSKVAYESTTDELRPYIMNKMFDVKDFEAGTVDFISCFQTLEHINSPKSMIEGFSHLLSKNGIIYCVAHNFGSVGVKILKARHPIVNAGHLTLFDKITIKKMFSKYLKVLDVFEISNRYSLRYWISLLPLSEKIKSLMLHTITLVGFDKIPITMSMGNIGIVAKKE